MGAVPISRFTAESLSQNCGVEPDVADIIQGWSRNRLDDHNQRVI